MSTPSFAQFGLLEPLVAALAKRNITEPFPIQTAAIPLALEGRDIKGKAPTGSGKTLAFGLPLVQMVGRAERHRPRALILAPTRELAEQIHAELRPLALVADRRIAPIYGGVSYGPQIGALRKGVDILVATPGRLEDLLAQGIVDLSDVDVVVVDEADRMADMGFLPAVRRILDMTSSDRHTMLFSATLDGDVSVLSRDFQNDPVVVEAGRVDESSAVAATHHFWKVEHHDRVAHTAEVIGATGRSIVFTRTRHGADRLAKQLGAAGVGAVALHGGRSQGQRTKALNEFMSGRTQALVATDVAARGIHVDGVATVIHFDMPGDHKDYLHRSGRTARAGSGGTVVSLVTSAQVRDVKRMQRDLNMESPICAPSMGELSWTEPKIRPTQAEPRSRPARTKPEPSRRSGRENRAKGDVVSIYVGNLPWTTTEADLGTLFKGHGRVKSATIITDRRTGRAKGYGFVDMLSNDGVRAVESLKNARLDGRPLKIKIAQD